jgi:hypothetical protein
MARQKINGSNVTVDLFDGHRFLTCSSQVNEKLEVSNHMDSKYL